MSSGITSIFRLSNGPSLTENEASSSAPTSTEKAVHEDVFSPPVFRLRRSANNFKTPIQHSGKYSNIQLSSKRQRDVNFN